VNWSSPAAKRINLIAYAPGVKGPLVADAYYPVAAPSPTVKETAAQVNVWNKNS
jgi:hypothetical protein